MFVAPRALNPFFIGSPQEKNVCWGLLFSEKLFCSVGIGIFLFFNYCTISPSFIINKRYLYFKVLTGAEDGKGLFL